jgi:hypothetical protein
MRQRNDRRTDTNCGSDTYSLQSNEPLAAITFLGNIDADGSASNSVSMYSDFLFLCENRKFAWKTLLNTLLLAL